ncbi:cyclin-dependent kinase 2-associated protein 1 isoform X1 [Oncorhynchus tshawytscha]|uniref:cyclin-dependent kinase 2-associated protein 1 isoform X1 n=1 Tax=Oncorhynchus tshawytscha TaxID=74940 RepID=UPI000D09D1E5|nr:cyclin-dependent kinase 2-associated protein 1 isoform X1 [Oncorhynchus tshawytscha]
MVVYYKVLRTKAILLHESLPSDQRCNWKVGNIPSPSAANLATLQSYRPLVNDVYAPPSLGFTQGSSSSQVPQSKYSELLAIIEELGKEIRPTYAGSKSAMERIKRGIIHARGLVRECLAETERNARS